MSISQISVVIIAKNAEETIGLSLESLQAFENVVLYLNDSTDGTKEIANKYDNVTIVEGEFIGFGPTKNASTEHSKHSWILSLDSDEVLNPELIDEMDILDLNNNKTVYALKRDNYFLGYKTQDSDVLVRLYNKDYTKFNDNIVHEKVIVPNDAKVSRLKTSFKHFNITNINQTLSKMIHYTDLSENEQKTCFFTIVILKSVFAFIKVYILKGNIFKGWVGFALGVNAANRRYYKYIKQFIKCKGL